MKKLIIGLAVLTAGYTVSAQEVIVTRTTTTSGTYNAYSIPEPIRMNYQSLYGDPALAVWTPMDGMWYATVKSSDNRIIHTYYSTDPWYLYPTTDDRTFPFRVALPVMNTFVPESVITNAITQHGNKIYSITKLSSGYQVGVIENGVLSTHVMQDDSQ